MGNMRLPVINGNENEIDVEAASKLIEVRPDEDVPAWVFRFLRAFPSVTVTLSGMSDMEQLKANIHTYEENKPLDEAEIATIQLEEYGMQVTVASNGKEAVKVFESCPANTFDVILMDLMMPEMNGYEATKAIRNLDNRSDGRDIPIIALTANALAEDVQASLDAGMNGHLSKPIQMDEVLKTIAWNINR